MNKPLGNTRRAGNLSIDWLMSGVHFFCITFSYVSKELVQSLVNQSTVEDSRVITDSPAGTVEKLSGINLFVGYLYEKVLLMIKASHNTSRRINFKIKGKQLLCSFRFTYKEKEIMCLFTYKVL